MAEHRMPAGMCRLSGADGSRLSADGLEGRADGAPMAAVFPDTRAVILAIMDTDIWSTTQSAPVCEHARIADTWFLPVGNLRGNRMGIHRSTLLYRPARVWYWEPGIIHEKSQKA